MEGGEAALVHCFTEGSPFQPTQGRPSHRLLPHLCNADGGVLTGKKSG